MSKLPQRPDVLPSIFEHLRESVLVTDADLEAPGPRIVYVNPAFTSLTGYAASEVLGRSPRLLQGPATARPLLDRLRRHLVAGEPFEGETINYRKDGTPFLMQWYIEPLPDADGRPEHFLAVQRDVTQERERSRQQRAVEQAMRQLVDFALLFGTDGTVTYANRSYLTWSGAEASTIPGARIWNLPGAPRRRDLRWARRVLGQGAAWRQQYAVRHQGLERQIFVTVSPIFGDGSSAPGGGLARPTEFIAVARDVTEPVLPDAVDGAESLLDLVPFSTS